MRQAVIVSPRIIAAHQFASMLFRHGWQCRCLHDTPDPGAFDQMAPQLTVVDITRKHPAGVDLLRRLVRQEWKGYRVALCEQGITSLAWTTRRIPIDGFFHLNRHGMSIDPHGGLAPIFLRSRPASASRCASAPAAAAA